MQLLVRRSSIALFCFALSACSGSGGLSSAIPAQPGGEGGADESARAATSQLRATPDAMFTGSSTGPYRVHAFLEDSPGNFGCLFSGNYAAVRNEADIAESGGSDRGRHACPGSFDQLRHAAGFKTYAYNDVAIVGNAMPVSAISSGYYYKNKTCSAPFIQPANGYLNYGRQIPNLAHYPAQIAAQTNDWEAKSDADFFFNDNFGNIISEGVDVGSMCDWSIASYVSGFPTFLDDMRKPQIVNLASDYDDVYSVATAKANFLMMSAEEGIVNFKRGLMFSMSETESKLNRMLEFQNTGHRINLIQYNPGVKDKNGDPIEFPPGFQTMYDQRMWNYAGGWLVLDYDHFYMQTANEGNFTNSGATVEPEYYLVPQNPLTTVGTGNLYPLQRGNLLVREYRTCYYKGRLIGTCAMVLNPNPSANSIPKLSQTYNHSVVISGEGAMPALRGVGGGVSTPADDGRLSYAGPRVTSVSAGRAVILIQ